MTAVHFLSLARTHCKRGHEFNAENTHLSPRGVRICRACKRATAKQLYDATWRAA